ncbi:MAG: hypothetical protein JO197_00090 [Acidobacteria bacterium]|nr:hypothetical protein [Acidobacteriota bacterium]
MERRVRIGAALLVGLVLALQLTSIVRRAGREPHKDEPEYLHAAWLMAHGDRVYESFFEHHPPFLFAAFEAVASDDVPAYFVRARLVSGACALIALASFAALLWRVRPEAAPIALALLFIAQPLWTDGLTAARVEPFAMAFFWLGAALIVLPREATFAPGVGLGLVAIAGLWSPKWPLSSAVIAAFWLLRARRRVVSAAIALALVAVALLLLRSIAPFDELWFFNVEFNRLFWPMLARSQDALREDLHGGVRFLYAPSVMRPLTMLVVFVLGGCAWFSERVRERRLVVLFLALAVASLLELRFVFPWPVLWPHYYLMWTFAGAALLGLVPAGIEALLARAKLRYASEVGFAVAAFLVLLLAAYVVAIAPFDAEHGGTYWVSQRYFAEHLRPGDTVLLDIRRHPVAARDASYYWFGLGSESQLIRRDPRAAKFLPPRAPLPFCAMLRGARTSLRYVSAPRLIGATPDEARCFQQLLGAKLLHRTPITDVYEP